MFLGLRARYNLPLRQACRGVQVHAERNTKIGSVAEKNSQSKSGDFYEGNEVDQVFPKREPGDFPKIGVQSNVIAAPSGTSSESTTTKPEAEFDPLRDGPARYLGYANELGEAFRAWIPVWGVPASYAVAIAYVVTDTFDKAIKANSQARKELSGNAALPADDVSKLVTLITAERFVDTLTWQLLASVAVPGFTIHTVVDIVHHVIELGLGTTGSNDISALPPAIAAAVASIASSTGQEASAVVELIEKSVPTMAGLATIPFIVHPIDNLIHLILNKSMRPALKSYICESAGGAKAGLDLCDECKVDSNGSH